MQATNASRQKGDEKAESAKTKVRQLERTWYITCEHGKMLAVLPTKLVLDVIYKRRIMAVAGGLVGDKKCYCVHHVDLYSYCWWLKPCTTWDVWNPKNNGINYLSTGAGFQPSTVPFLATLKFIQSIRSYHSQVQHPERWRSNFFLFRNHPYRLLLTLIVKTFDLLYLHST